MSKVKKNLSPTNSASAIVEAGAELWRMVQLRQFVEAVAGHPEGVGHPAISSLPLGRLVAWVPPVLEQVAIPAFLDRGTQKIDILVARIRKRIELLKEYRTAPLSATATGKIDLGRL